MTKATLIVMSAALFTLVACEDEQYQGGAGVDAGATDTGSGNADASGEDTAPSTDSGVSDTGTLDTSAPDTGVADTSAQPDVPPDFEFAQLPELYEDLCAPRTTAMTDEALARRALRWMRVALDQGCTITEARESSEADGMQVMTYEGLQPPTCDMGRCAQELPRSVWVWTDRDDLSGRTVRWRGTLTGSREATGDQTTIRVALAGRRVSNTLTWRWEWTFDEAGHMLTERRWQGDWLVFDIRFAWEGDQRVSAVREDFRSDRDAPVTTEMTWTYTADGLLESGQAHQLGGPVHRARWTYDGGRPVAVERRWREVIEVANETVWLEQTWTWDGDRVVERTTDLRPERAGIPEQLPDDMGPTTNYYLGNWEDARTIEGAACVRPPTSITHGYPEAWYDLGWSLDERPTRIGFDHRYDGFAYNYGSLAWYGHYGVATAYIEPNSDATITTRYDDQGRMVEERVVTLLPGMDVESVLDRERLFDGERLVVDSLNDPRRDDPLELRFEFVVSDGFEQLRTHRQGDAVFSRQQWVYDGDRLTDYAIDIDEAILSLSPFGPLDPSLLMGLETIAIYTQDWTDTSEGTRMTRTRSAPGSPEVEAEEWSQLTTNDGGAIRQFWEQGFQITVERDAQGRLRRYNNGPSDDLSEATEITYLGDDTGLVQTWRTRAVNSWEGEYTYTCR